MQGCTETVTANDAAGKERILQAVELPYWFNCGVTLESQHFVDGGPTVPRDKGRLGQPNLKLEEISQRNQERLVRDGRNRIVAFTDGAACHPDDPRRRRASWGVHYANGHPYNANGPSNSDIQTVYRAELTAVLHAFQAANVPTIGRDRLPSGREPGS